MLLPPSLLPLLPPLGLLSLLLLLLHLSSLLLVLPLPLLRLLLPLPLHTRLLSLGFSPSRAARVRASAVSLVLPLLLLLLLLPPLLLPLLLLLLLLLLRELEGLSQPVPMLAAVPACGEAPGIPASRWVGPLALPVPADVVPPDGLTELPLVVASWILRLGPSLILGLIR